MKYRILQHDNALFYPQFKPGFFRRWRYFKFDADTSPWMREAALATFDAAGAARFTVLTLAEEFVVQVIKKANAYRFGKNSASQRSSTAKVVKEWVE